MTTKLTLTVQKEKESMYATDEAMTATIRLLSELVVLPTTKLTLAIECNDDDTAEQVADELDAVLSGRPVGIEVIIETKSKRHIERRKVEGVLPMDKTWR
jgi:hypothetical protein